MATFSGLDDHTLEREAIVDDGHHHVVCPLPLCSPQVFAGEWEEEEEEEEEEENEDLGSTQRRFEASAISCYQFCVALTPFTLGGRRLAPLARRCSWRSSGPRRACVASRRASAIPCHPCLPRQLPARPAGFQVPSLAPWQLQASSCAASSALSRLHARGWPRRPVVGVCRWGVWVGGG